MSQLDGKWVKSNTLNGDHVRLLNAQCLRSRNNAGDGDIEILQVNSADAVEFCAQPKYATAPTANDDLANKSYVDDVVYGLRDPKDACVCATTANIDLTTGGFLVIDGITTTVGMRVLVKNQTDPVENGMYEADSGAWARLPDADTAIELNEGASTLITSGTLNARKLYVLASGQVGAPQTWVQAPNPANFLVPKEAEFTLAAGDITNGYIDLAHEAEAESIKVTPVGGPKQQAGTDYTISVASNVSRITFAGNLASLAAAGDILMVDYSYATS